jgi:hypothetical protein
MGNALIGIFLSAVGFLQKGLAEALEIARPLAELFGKGESINSAQGALRESADILDAEAAARYSDAGDQLGPLAAKVAERLKEAGENIVGRFGETFRNTAEVIDTSAMRERMNEVLGTIRDALPKPEEIKQVARATTPGKSNVPNPLAQASTTTMDPIVTSLGKVGGGGYSSGTLDAQRENNRLTSETNRILRAMSERIKPGGAASVTAFG